DQPSLPAHALDVPRLEPAAPRAGAGEDVLDPRRAALVGRGARRSRPARAGLWHDGRRVRSGLRAQSRPGLGLSPLRLPVRHPRARGLLSPLACPVGARPAVMFRLSLPSAARLALLSPSFG